jgi:hypothetical protein
MTNNPENNIPGAGKSLDDLFRENVGTQEFTPAPKVWRHLNRKLLSREIIRFNFTNVPRFFLYGAAGSAVVIATVAYLLLSPFDPAKSADSHPEIAGKMTVQQEIPVVSSQPSGTINQDVPSKGSSSSGLKPSGPVTADYTPAPRSSAARSVNQHNTMLASLPRASVASMPALPSLPSAGVTSSTEAAASSFETIGMLEPKDFEGFELISRDTLCIIRNGVISKFAPEAAPLPSFFSASLAVSPEMALLNTNGSAVTEFNYWANALVAYHFSRFTVRTGLGIGLTYDEGKYQVKYISNDSVSYYKEVIAYYSDPADPSKIIYVTRNHVIYDSVTHLADDRTRNRFTYIQVPLLVGMNLLETPRFNLGFELGPAMTVLIGEKKAQPEISIPNGRLILVQDVTAPRASLNWQLWAKLNIEYQFTKQWGIFVNPYYKYYLNAPTKSEDGRSINQAFGIDVGIQYLFGRKKKVR